MFDISSRLTTQLAAIRVREQPLESSAKLELR